LRFHSTHFYLICAVLPTDIAVILNNALFLPGSLSTISVQRIMISGNIFGHNDSNCYSLKVNFSVLSIRVGKLALCPKRLHCEIRARSCNQNV